MCNGADTPQRLVFRNGSLWTVTPLDAHKLRVLSLKRGEALVCIPHNPPDSSTAGGGHGTQPTRHHEDNAV